MIKKVLVLAGIIIVAIGGYYFFGGKSKQAPETPSTPEPTTIPVNTSTEPTPIDETVKEKAYTLEEISKHENAIDCWFAIEGKVYDVTEFIASGNHPGKDAILQGCGKDATELFNTRPMGSGTPHSDKARAMLKNFEIGAVKK